MVKKAVGLVEQASGFALGPVPAVLPLRGSPYQIEPNFGCFWYDSALVKEPFL